MSTTIELDQELQDIIERLINMGRYSNADEVVEAALSLLQQYEQEREKLMQELQKGSDSDTSDRSF